MRAREKSRAAIAAAAASYVVATMWRPFAVSLDGVGARRRKRTGRPPLVTDGDPGRPIRETQTALESARGLPPDAALRAQLRACTRRRRELLTVRRGRLSARTPAATCFFHVAASAVRRVARREGSDDALARELGAMGLL